MAEETSAVCGESADSVKNNNNKTKNVDSTNMNNKNQTNLGCGDEGGLVKKTANRPSNVLPKSRQSESENGDFDDIEQSSDYDVCSDEKDEFHDDSYEKKSSYKRTRCRGGDTVKRNPPGTPVLCYCNNRDGCASLRDILESFDAPISEEQAWALIYQTIKLYRDAFKRPDFQKEHIKVPRSVENLNVHKDGTVHINFKGSQDQNSYTVTSQKKILMRLATVVYKALDYNLPEDEQCILSDEMVQLISHMTAEDADDEGIEKDSEEIEEDEDKCFDTKELDYILELCTPRVQPSVPEEHYKAVCRALVTESLELRVFLQKVFDGEAETLRLKADAQTSRQELEKLGFQDWARFWMQVLDELRRGVRLKKNNFSRTPVEYELTPYEILMEDIRTKKYNLRKVMVNGDIPPRVKKDAHAVILEFIRSRPPLKKASERKLRPPIKLAPTPREQLMDSIRKGRPLKPIQSHLKNRLLPPTQADNIKKEETPAQNQSPKSKQRLIKVDFSLLQDDDLYDLPPSGSSSLSSTTHRGCTTQMPSYPTLYNNENNPNNINAVRRRTTYDLATQCESRRASTRRHTIVGCQSNLSGTHSTPPSRPDSRQSEINNLGSNTRHYHNIKQQKQTTNQTLSDNQQSQSQTNSNKNGLDNSDDSNNLSSMGQFTKGSLDEKQWTERISDRLSLTLEEIVHIRSVMTKAELEGLPVGIRVKEDVEKRKVCFLCLRTRFSIFGPWGIQCKLCQRTVCSKCYTKMRIPTEHFRNVPVILLSPSLMNSPVGSNASSPSHYAHITTSSSAGPSSLMDEFPKSLMERLLRPESDRKIRNTVGSAPSSPKHQRSNTGTPNSTIQIEGQHAPKQFSISQLATSDSNTNGVLGANNSNKENTYSGYINGTSSTMSTMNRNLTSMSRSMEGPKSLPVQSPARPHSNSSTLDRKNRFTRAFTLSSSADQKENTLRGELMAVCNDCRGLVLEIIRSSRQTRSSARNRALKNLTLDLSPVYKRW